MYEVAPLPVKVTDCPAQIEVAVALAVTVGAELTVTVTWAVFWQLLAPVPVTVYVVVVKGVKATPLVTPLSQE